MRRFKIGKRNLMMHEICLEEDLSVYGTKGSVQWRGFKIMIVITKQYLYNKRIKPYPICAMTEDMIYGTKETI